MKKKIVIHSNHSKAFTGFGKNAKNILKHLHATGKYDIVEFCNGVAWSNPDLKKLPWKCRGALPDDPRVMEQLNKDPQLGRAAGYGAQMVDQIIKQEKPDLYLGIEDIWGFNGYMQRPWWNKTNCMIWTTLDSLPILPDAINNAPHIKNYYVWATFAEKALRALGHDHVRTLHGSLDTSTFFRLPIENRSQLRLHHRIPAQAFIVGFVFRNQLRKSVPNLLEGFKLFQSQEPRANSYLLLHTHWSEGWDIPRLLAEKGIDANRVLTTYFCNKCGAYEVRPFTGQEQRCKSCLSEKSLNTTNVTSGVSEQQLNEVYNLMDVYCHPFTSGGQEIPVQEAKLTELITLVTNYSCGEDSCTPASGGIPLDWSEYREPGTQFIKASTYASSISKGLKKVFKMSPKKRAEEGEKSRQFVIDNYDTSIIGKNLEAIIDDLPPVEWDFNFEFVKRDPDYSPDEEQAHEEWLIDIYKNILRMDVNSEDDGHKHWMQRLSTDLNRSQILQHFQHVAREENTKNLKQDFATLFDSKPNRKKALLVLNSDANTIFSSTALLRSFSETYPDADLYFACPPQFRGLLNGNPYIYKILDFDEFMGDELRMLGHGQDKGYVDYYFNLTNGILTNLSLTSANFDLCI